MEPVVQQHFGEKRRQAEARRVALAAYPFVCCVVCGLRLKSCMTVAHLDHRPGNNDADNLAWLCPTHHGMYDCELYPVEAIRLLRSHWQETEGVACHRARMKQAGAKAAATRKRTAAAKKAWATRRRLDEAESVLPGRASAG